MRNSAALSQLPARVAVAQVPVIAADLDVNVERAVSAIAQAGADGADLLVLPEAFLSGYLFESRAAARAVAIGQGDARVAALVEACRVAGVHAVVGCLEEDGPHVYNSALTLGPSGVVGNYRKQHLPFLGVDRFIDPGTASEPRVMCLPFGRVGVMICFDLRVPEAARVLALQGADLIAMPTNWPAGVSILPDHFAKVRAAENRVYLAVADRPDEEAGVAFSGRGQVVDPRGEVLVDAAGAAGIFAVDVDLSHSREKTIVFEPGVFESPTFAARRPELYGDIAATR